MNQILWIELEVQFVKPLAFIKETAIAQGEVLGYLQEIGVTFSESESQLDPDQLEIFLLKNVVRAEYVDNVELDFSAWDITEDNIKEVIYDDPDVSEALLSDPREPGIWYKTGCAFFGAE